jgi:sugar O-acyltransferase (sialic acid O-acetyltransferase NeuD family)
MPKSLVILGTGGSAYDVLDIAEAINARSETWEVAGFLDDSKPIGSEHAGFKLLGRLCDAGKFAGHYFINAIGSDTSYARRPLVVASTSVTADRFATLVHPNACVSLRARLGRGVYVSPGASIGGGAVVGDHVCIGPGAIIGHDAVIGDHATLAPGAIVSGFVRLGRACYVGAGAAVRQKLEVGDGALVGIGAVVLRDVSPNTVVVGNPTRVLRRIEAALNVVR